MLRQLVINDLAIINTLNLDLKAGMTVLTGETGAGKSILLDALGLVLGDRADSNIIRGGKDKTDITAIFAIENNPPINALLDDLEIASDKELFIRRVIRRDGRSRAYLNNTPIPVQRLRDIGEQLIDIHGQHVHQSLSRPAIQRTLLDQSGGYAALTKEVTTTYQEWKKITTKLKKMDPDDDDGARKTLFRYQIDELAQFNLSKVEYATLSEKHKRLSNSRKLLEICQKILIDLSESDMSINSRLVLYQREITDLCKIDNALGNIKNILDSTVIQIGEATSELNDYIDQFDADTSQLTDLENRLDSLHALSRKHRVKPEQLPEQLDFLISQLQQLEGGQEQRGQLKQHECDLKTHYYQLAEELHKKRKKTAATIASTITEKMQELGVGGKFNIDVEKRDDKTLRPDGMDKITFLVSTNPGQPLRPINKVASGGELSRLSLAIQIVGSKDNGVPTMIFDEVDAGISGGIAEIVGKTLTSLAKHRQIFCVTHLAQVASCAHHHLQVNKTTNNSKTFTQVIELNKQERIDEVARMLAGMEVTSESRANAKKMLGII